MLNMRMLFHKSKQTASVFGVVMILLLVVLAACGNSDSNSGTGGQSTTTGGAPTSANQPTPTPTSIPGYGTTQGCPSDAVISNAPKANQSVVLKGQGTTVTAHTGDVIELRFPFGKKWMGPRSAPAQLQMQQPAGYALKSDKVCVWRFTAQSAGTAELHFTSRALCKAGTMCPMYVIDVPVTVTVK